MPPGNVPVTWTSRSPEDAVLAAPTVTEVDWVSLYVPAGGLWIPIVFEKFTGLGSAEPETPRVCATETFTGSTSSSAQLKPSPSSVTLTETEDVPPADSVPGEPSGERLTENDAC